MEKKLKHIELIQNIISRMANNSFTLKSWTITMITALLAFLAINDNIFYFFIAYIPIFVFWFLDSYYLLQERLYRSLYNEVKDLDVEKINFDLNANKYLSKTPTNKYLNCLLSKTEIWFYLPLVVIITIVLILSMFL